jgi:hypothetical protein
MEKKKKKEKKEKDLELKLEIESCCTLAESLNRAKNELWGLVPNSETER